MPGEYTGREAIDDLAGSYWNPNDGTADHVYKIIAAEVRTATLREAAEITYKMASDMREGDSEEYPEEWSSREVRDAVNEVGDTLQGLAEEK